MFRMLKMLVSVPIVMTCATAGTVGLIKTIEKTRRGRTSPKALRRTAKDDCVDYDCIADRFGYLDWRVCATRPYYSSCSTNAVCL